MKNLTQFLSILLVALVFTACSSDDNNNNDSGNSVFSGDYFPSSVANYWNYDVTIENVNTNQTTQLTDSLYVFSQQNSSFKLNVNTNNIANGSKNRILVSGDLEKQTNKLVLNNGGISLPIEGFTDFGFDVSNFVLYDTDAATGTELSSVSSSVTQPFQGVDLVLTYTLKSEKLQNQESFSLNDDVYNVVTSTKLSLILKVDATVPQLPIPLPIIDQQEVMTINSFFAKDVGLIKADSNISYEINSTTATLLEQQFGIDLSNANVNVNNTQELSSYNIQ